LVKVSPHSLAESQSRSDKQNGGRSSTKPENSVSELLEEGSLFARHVAISLIGVAPEEVATSMPYLVMFGILLAVLSFCALSRQTEDGAFLTSSLAHLRASSTADTASDELKAARRAARAGPRPARTGPPDLRPQAQSSQSSQTGQSPLISLCPELVVPEKVECTLLVPLVRGHAAKRASTLPVSDVKGETIFLLETIPDGRSSDGTRQSGLCHCSLHFFRTHYICCGWPVSLDGRLQAHFVEPHEGREAPCSCPNWESL